MAAHAQRVHGANSHFLLMFCVQTPSWLSAPLPLRLPTCPCPYPSSLANMQANPDRTLTSPVGEASELTKDQQLEHMERIVQDLTQRLRAKEEENAKLEADKKQLRKSTHANARARAHTSACSHTGAHVAFPPHTLPPQCKPCPHTDACTCTLAHPHP